MRQVRQAGGAGVFGAVACREDGGEHTFPTHGTEAPLTWYLRSCCADWRSWSYESGRTGRALRDWTGSGSPPIRQGDLAAPQEAAVRARRVCLKVTWHQDLNPGCWV